MEVIFKIRPLGAPASNGTIISGIAEVKHHYLMDFFFWNGAEYVDYFSFISPASASADDGIDAEFLDLDLFSIFSSADLNQYLQLQYKDNYILEINPHLQQEVKIKQYG
jgi:hypothetical protein